MAVRPVAKLPDLILRRKAYEVDKFDKNFQQLVNDMIDTMRDEPGVGLAATQVSVPTRVIVVEYPLDDSQENAGNTLFVVANPTFEFLSEEKISGIEGCLSVPNLVGEVDRSTSIRLRGVNRKGKKISIQANGWLARIFQHEVDHLNGILYVDRAKTLYKPDNSEALDRV